jgi:hypothetical protein
MDFSRLNYPRLAVGLTASAVLIIAILFLPWYSYDRPEDSATFQDADAWICGVDEDSCTGFETFPILRWLLLLAALAPIILAYILVRAHRLSYPPGEMTMLAGAAAFVLIFYNGILDRPAPDNGLEFGIGLSWGYWLALICSFLIGLTGYLRSQASGGKQERKAPGTV